METHHRAELAYKTKNEKSVRDVLFSPEELVPLPFSTFTSDAGIKLYRLV